MDNNKILIAKAVTKFVVGRSVGRLMLNGIKANVPTYSRSEELQLMVGTFVVGGIVAEKGIDWAEQKFDEAVVAIQTIIEVRKANQPV